MNFRNHVSSDDYTLRDLSLKKTKKHHEIDVHRQTYHFTSAQPKENCNLSLKIVEANSEPDLTAVIKATLKKDHSYLEVEKLVSNLDLAQRNLKGPNELCETRKVDLSFEHSPKRLRNEEENNAKSIPNIMLRSMLEVGTRPGSPASQYCTPMKSTDGNTVFITPSKAVPKSPSFKTPLNFISIKKSSSACFKRSKNFQHIASPIAAYIKNSPQVPLVQDVHPKKPLPGISMIPKLLKPKNLGFDKENINLPNLAYKTAKHVKVINESDCDKLPQSKLTKKVSSLPKPLVMKHNHREINSTKKSTIANPEDSFANLTLHQADISMCTQKSAFDKPKKGNKNC